MHSLAQLTDVQGKRDDQWLTALQPSFISQSERVALPFVRLKPVDWSPHVFQETLSESKRV